MTHQRMLAALFSAALSCAVAAAEDRPNFLVIVADDLGYGDLGCYGAKDLATPHLDRLASSGIRFTRHYANCPVCSPTRASLLTGRYPELAGVPGVIRTHADDNWGWLDPDVKLLPAALREVGYRSIAIGKWHLGLEPDDHPLARGFDRFHGFLGDMMDDYFHHRRHDVNYMRDDRETIDPEGHATDLFTDWAIEELRAASNSPDQPFLLYLAYNAPHTPIQPPEDWSARRQAAHPELSDRRNRLAALIEHLDDGVGRVLATLEETGLAQHTVVVFVSDNGGQTGVGADNGELRAGKGTMYEGGIRVPAIVAWPGRIAPGESDRIWLSMDVYPTLFELAGAATPNRLDGRSFAPSLLGEEQPPEVRDLYWVRREGGEAYMGQTIWAARRGDWKLLQNKPFEPFQLFHLGDDPAEEHDLAESEPQVRRELSAALRAHLQRGGAVPWQRPAAAKQSGD